MRNRVSCFCSLLVITIIVATLSPSLAARHLEEEDLGTGGVENNGGSKGQMLGSDDSRNYGSAGEKNHPNPKQPGDKKHVINVPPSPTTSTNNNMEQNSPGENNSPPNNFQQLQDESNINAPPPCSCTEENSSPDPVDDTTSTSTSSSSQVITYPDYPSPPPPPPLLLPRPRPAYYSSSTGTTTPREYYYVYRTTNPNPTGYQRSGYYYRTPMRTACPLYTRC